MKITFQPQVGILLNQNEDKSSKKITLVHGRGERTSFMLICLTSQFELRKNEKEKGSGDKSHSHSSNVQVVYFPRSTYSKMLTKIPFILLATWGIYMSCKPPNPQPPQRERFPLSVPHWQWLENSGYVQWAPVIIRVSNYACRIFFIRTH